jgi:hypothetical protein
MSRLRIRDNKREIARLTKSLVANCAVIDDRNASEDDKVQAAHRLAEINLRINLLEAENQRL